VQGTFVSFYIKRDEHMKIRRLEHKLGIHGSPTCELQFNNAPATLVGERKRGLSKYTMWLMNNARLGIAAQAMGIAEAAYREASKYANERIQFDQLIKEFPPIYEMLTEMTVAIEGGEEAFLVRDSKVVDLNGKGLEGDGHGQNIPGPWPVKVQGSGILEKGIRRLANLFYGLWVEGLPNRDGSTRLAYDAIPISRRNQATMHGLQVSKGFTRGMRRITNILRRNHPVCRSLRVSGG